MKHQLILGDCLEVLQKQALQLHGYVPHMIFADPPDNIGLNYGHMSDDVADDEYIHWLEDCLMLFTSLAPIVWLSYNTRWQFSLGGAIMRLLKKRLHYVAKPCVQTFTFYQHNSRALGNAHRPLLLLYHADVTLHYDAIRTQSERQKRGDPRADPRGKIPGDVFDFPRVVGNSRQRRSWHPTQLNEGLVERCIKLSTRPGERVLDPFAGTGTTLRVCKRIDRQCTLVENSEAYCRKLAAEHNLPIESGDSRDLPGQRFFPMMH